LPRVRNCSSRESPNNAIDYFALRLLQNGLYSGGTRALNSPEVKVHMKKALIGDSYWVFVKRL